MNKLRSTLIYFVGILSAVRGLEVGMERPEISYTNPEYVRYANTSSVRTSRGGDMLLSAHISTRHTWGNNISLHAVFYEFLSNEYRRSFVEVHRKLCDMMTHEQWFIPLVGSALKNYTCPYPSHNYSFVNLTAAPMKLSDTFPFSKSLLNVTLHLTDGGEVIFCGHVHLNTTRQKRLPARDNSKKHNTRALSGVE